MPTKIKIDGGDYGIKDESKSSRITSVGSPLWRKGTWNVIARPRNLCAAPNLHSQIVNSALALTLSLRIFGSKLWLHVSCKRREKKFGGKKSLTEGRGSGAKPKTALPLIIGRVWRCMLRVNDPFFPRQIFEALGSVHVCDAPRTEHYIMIPRNNRRRKKSMNVVHALKFLTTITKRKPRVMFPFTINFI